MMVIHTSGYEKDGMTLGALLAEGIADFPLSAKEIFINGLALNSEKIRPGNLFFACHGLQCSGHNYIQQAIKQGAVAVLYEEPYDLLEPIDDIPLISVTHLRDKLGLIADRFYDYPSQSLNVVGVTGTNGKSSCSYFIAQTLSKGRSVPCGLMGTLGHGLYGNLSSSTHTTPDAVSVHKVLHQISNKGANDVVMEVSSHGLQQGRVNNVHFKTAVFTNLTRDHLDYHGSMAAYLAAKLKLFKNVHLESAVINMADRSAKIFLDCLNKQVSVIGYRLYKTDTEKFVDSGIRMINAVFVESSLLGMTAKISSPWGQGVLRSNLLGHFNIENLLATLGVLLLNGVSFDDALARLSTVRALTGRMESFQSPAGKGRVVVDYAHTPDALAKVLQTLRSHTAGNLWCVFGCGGDRDKGKRPQMGEIAATFCDHLLITDDNPRNENPEKIIREITACLPGEYTIIHDRALAIKFAIEQAEIDDVVLIAGKGHETYQEKNGKYTYFSDRQEVAKNLDCQGCVL
ncbi:MAG: UDP-N-acetylmuramoyl-L-alanyl-D-glutamate--2,6-diaminopimelate ligase [Gammaproteobacteria bacterium]|nr:UDP-N-acetylmuramoyl-L-alanyl-D-glutamate--2,6-diaminopimelate ligase [Gammaproteobacteria bacterium]